MPSFECSTYFVYACWEVRNLEFLWWLIIVKFSKILFKRNFDPLPDWIFEKFQRIWKALWKYFWALSSQNSRFRHGKGSFWGSKLKKIFGEKFAKSWSRGFPLEGKPLIFFENFLVNSKLYFFRVVPSKRFDCSVNANKSCARRVNFTPPPVLLGLNIQV